MIISERGNYEIVISTRRNSNEPVNELLSNKYLYNTQGGKGRGFDPLDERWIYLFHYVLKFAASI